MIGVFHTKMSGDRRVAIPAELCHEYGLKPRGTVVLEASEAGIVLRSLDAVISEVQAAFVDVAPPNVLVSEELIRDRREEAALGERETEAWLREYGRNRE
jgi:bifunctional DNA-binding transcriptional regulator/antitoxin component of YhaV-PrlF toxin-antitoxin module